MTRNRLRFVVAQLTPRPGAAGALARLIAADDLPGLGWHVIDERTWRTGVSGPPTEWGGRARAARSVTAWRSFELAARQWCWIQAVPLVSAADALAAIEGIGDRALPNLRSEVTVVQEQDVAIEPFPGAAAVWAHEQQTTGPKGPGVARMLAAATGTHLVVLSVSGSPVWEWDAMVALARRQADLLTAESLE